ncbi:MAG: hypothetical protein ACK47B_16560 [Armatimonadota bacterium]
MAAHFRDAAMLLVMTGILAYFAGGFVAGVVWCRDCHGLIGNTLGRLFIGIVMAVLSALSGGFPPQNEAGVGEPRNAWPFILGCWAVFFVGSFLWLRRQRGS